MVTEEQQFKAAASPETSRHLRTKKAGRYSRTRLSCFALAIALITPLSHTAPWHTNLDSAQTQADDTNKPLLILFTGSDWCLWCQKLETELFSQAEFVSDAHERVVPVKLDFPRRKPLPPKQQRRNQLLKADWKVETFPTVILYDPSTRTEIWRHSYINTTPKDYLEAISKATHNLNL